MAENACVIRDFFVNIIYISCIFSGCKKDALTNISAFFHSAFQSLLLAVLIIGRRKQCFLKSRLAVTTLISAWLVICTINRF